MASKLPLPPPPPPPPPLATARSSSAVHGPMVSHQSKLPVPASRCRSRLHSNDEAELLATHRSSSSTEQMSYPASVSSSASSSPDMAAVANGTAVMAMVAPPRLELHELSHGKEVGKGAVDASAVVWANPHEHDDGDVKSHHQPQPQPRSGIPSAGTKSVHFRTRTTPGTTQLQTTSVREKEVGKQTPSRIGRYEPKKKPLLPMIETHWSAGADTQADTNGVDHSGTIPPPPAVSDPTSPRRASPLSGFCAPRTSKNGVAPPPMTPLAVRAPFAHVNGIVRGDPVSTEIAANASAVEPQKVLSSPPVVQRLKTSVEPLKTPSGSPAFESFNDDDESKLSASQRVRMGLSVLMTQGNGLSNGASETTRRYSHEEEVERSQDEGVAAPLSCPRMSQSSGKQQFSALRETRHISPQQQRRGSSSIASKLLPSRMFLNNLIEYVRELHQSAASLRVQLEQTKQKAEQELVASQLEASLLQESMQRVELEREQARTRIQEQEQLMRHLQAQVSDLQQQLQVMRTSRSASSFREGEAFVSESSSNWAEQHGEQGAVAAGIDSVPVAQKQEIITSPRLAKPLWEPWSSGSNSPLATAAPPMFTITPSNLDLLPSSPQLAPEIVSSSTSASQAHVLRSIVSPTKVIRSPACEKNEKNVSAVPPNPSVSATTEEQVDAALNLMTPPPNYELQMSSSIVDSREHGSLIALAEIDDSLQHVSAVDPSPRKSVTPTKAMHRVQPPQPHDDTSNNESSATADEPSATPPKLLYPSQAHSSGKASLSKATAESTAVSLEKLLTDFFSEFDKGKMRMAEVYGKRYVDHEDRLFAELTRRYGKEKVIALQRRYEGSLVVGDVDTSQSQHELHAVEAFQAQDSQAMPPSAVPPAPMQHLHAAAEEVSSVQQGQTKQGLHVKASLVKSEEVPTQKVSPTGKPLPIAGFHDRAYPPVVSCIEEDSEIETDASSSTSNSAAPPLLVAATFRDSEGDHVKSRYAPTSQSSEQSPPGSPQRVAPQRRQTPFVPAGGAVTLKTDAPPLPMRDSNPACNGGTKSSPIRRQGEPSTGHPSMLANFSEKSDAKKPAAAFSSPASSGSVEGNKDAAVSKPHSAEQPTTLESLLRELYQKHQPDKLRNVAQVAREFAGRERELVRFLRAKYGVLSVKRLEESLSALEKTSRQATPPTATKSHASKKKKGFISTFLTRCTLVSFTALSLGSAGLVLLDSRECHKQRYSSQPDKEGNAAACFRLTLDLEEFQIGKIQDYSAQSYPVECFCNEWVAREDELLSRYSSTNVINLAKMLPLSRATADAFVIDAPVHEYYTQYAKPLVEMSREYTSVIQSALADVGNEVSTQFTVLRERILPFVGEVDKPTAFEVDSNKGKKSALTKIAQASKSLLNNIQEETAAIAESEGEAVVSEQSDVVVDTEHTDDLESKSGEEQRAAGVDAAIVEVEVRQEGFDMSYPETKESLEFGVEDAKSGTDERPAAESDLSDAVAHVTPSRDGDESSSAFESDENAEVEEPRDAEFVAQVATTPGGEEEPIVLGGADQIELVTAETIQEVDRDSATSTAEDVVAVDALEGSVDVQNFVGDVVVEEESAETTASLEPELSVDAVESDSDHPVNESGDSKLPIASAVDETRALLTASESGELDIMLRPSGEAVDVSSSDGSQDALVKFKPREDEASPTTQSDEVHGAVETDDSVAIAEGDAEDVGATWEDPDDATAVEASQPPAGSVKHHPAETENERLSTETAPPPSAEEEGESLSTDIGSHPEDPHDSHAATGDHDDDDDGGEDFDFDVDPWELLEMAERAAAEQLHTLEQ